MRTRPLEPKQESAPRRTPGRGDAPAAARGRTQKGHALPCAGFRPGQVRARLLGCEAASPAAWPPPDYYLLAATLRSSVRASIPLSSAGFQASPLTPRPGSQPLPGCPIRVHCLRDAQARVSLPPSSAPDPLLDPELLVTKAPPPSLSFGPTLRPALPSRCHFPEQVRRVRSRQPLEHRFPRDPLPPLPGRTLRSRRYLQQQLDPLDGRYGSLGDGRGYSTCQEVLGEGHGSICHVGRKEEAGDCGNGKEPAWTPRLRGGAKQMADLYTGSRRPGGRRRGRTPRPCARGGGAAEWLSARREERWSRAGAVLRAARARPQHLTGPEEGPAPGSTRSRARREVEVRVGLDEGEARYFKRTSRDKQATSPP